METQTQACKSCGEPLHGTYCSNCGQKLIAERLTVKGVLTTALSNIFNVDRGLWHTIKMLFTRPGKVVQDYVNGNTRPYYNPFRYAFLMIAMAAFVSIFSGVFVEQVEQNITFFKSLGMYQTPEEEEKGRRAMNLMTNFLNVIPFLLLPFMSLATIWIFKKQKWYFALHVVLNTYVIGHTSLISLLTISVVYLNPALQSAYFLIGILTYVIVYGMTFKRLFKKNLVEGMVLGLLCYLSAFVLFLVTIGISAFVIGFSIAFIHKKFGS